MVASTPTSPPRPGPISIRPARLDRLTSAPPAGTAISAVGELLTPEASGRRPSLAAWSPDGKRLAYVWDEKGDGSEKSLWSLDVATGRSEVLLRPGELGAQGKDKPDKDTRDKKDEKTGIDAYAWSPKGDSLLIEAGGDLYLEALAGHALRRLTRTAAEEEGPRFSPD